MTNPPGGLGEAWQMLARENIRDLVARYNANGDTGRFDQVIELFADDAVMLIDGRPYRGPEEIRGIFTGARDGDGDFGPAPEVRPQYVRHHTATHQIDLVDETHATGRCYFQVLTQVGLDHWGRYVDAYEQVGGRWLITERRVTVDGYSQDSTFRRPPSPEGTE